jgi:hypothetical protein
VNATTEVQDHSTGPSEELLPAEEAIPIDAQQLLRLASVTHEVLEELSRMRPTPGLVGHLRRLHDRIMTELSQALPPSLHQELTRLTPEVGEESVEELALSYAEILGWLEGLFQGTQLSIQLAAAQAFRQQMRAARRPPARDASARDGLDTPYL